MQASGPFPGSGSVTFREHGMGEVTIIVSACLLGKRVRYDGKSKPEPLLSELWGRRFRLVGVCPEIEAGLNVPREAMRLEGDSAHPALRGVVSRRDFTAPMHEWLARRLPELAELEPDGFLLKSRSPSCGLAPVAVHGAPQPGAGLFARCVAAAFPELAVADESILHQPFARQRFLDKLLVMHRWRTLLNGHADGAAMSAFHQELKLLVMSHAPGRAGELDKLARRGDWGLYERKLAVVLDAMPGASKHDNIVRHLRSVVARTLSPEAAAVLDRAVRDAEQGKLDRKALLMLLKSHIDCGGPEEYRRQSYWDLLDPLY